MDTVPFGIVPGAGGLCVVYRPSPDYSHWPLFYDLLVG